MKYLICALLLIALAIPAAPASAKGESALPVDAILEKAGIPADAALRDKVAAFLEEHAISARVVGMMDADLARRYVEHLDQDLPLDYDALLNAEAIPLPEGADFGALRQLVLLHPDGAGAQSLAADFERGLLYYDESAPVVSDVCRAAHAVPLSEADAAVFMDILRASDIAEWDYDYPGDIASGVSILALAFDEGVVRYTVAGISMAPDSLIDTVFALLSAGADCVNG